MQNAYNEKASVSKAGQPGCDYKKIQLWYCWEKTGLPCSQASIHLQRILQTSPCRERKAVCNPPLVLLLHLHFFLIFTVTHTLTYISVSLPAPSVLCLINVCVLYPLLFAPRQLRHCSDGGGGRVYMCACVWVCQRQRGRERECRTEMEGGVSRDRERRGKWSGLNHESNRGRERVRKKIGCDGAATASSVSLFHAVMIKYTLAIKEPEPCQLEWRWEHEQICFLRYYVLADRPAAGLVVISLMTEKTYKIGREGEREGERRRRRRRKRRRRRGEEARGGEKWRQRNGRGIGWWCNVLFPCQLCLWQWDHFLYCYWL